MVRRPRPIKKAKTYLAWKSQVQKRMVDEGLAKKGRLGVFWLTKEGRRELKDSKVFAREIKGKGKLWVAPHTREGYIYFNRTGGGVGAIRLEKKAVEREGWFKRLRRSRVAAWEPVTREVYPATRGRAPQEKVVRDAVSKLRKSTGDLMHVENMASYIGDESVYAGKKPKLTGNREVDRLREAFAKLPKESRSFLFTKITEEAKARKGVDYVSISETRKYVNKLLEEAKKKGYADTKEKITHWMTVAEDLENLKLKIPVEYKQIFREGISELNLYRADRAVRDLSEKGLKTKGYRELARRVVEAENIFKVPGIKVGKKEGKTMKRELRKELRRKAERELLEDIYPDLITGEMKYYGPGKGEEYTAIVGPFSKAFIATAEYETTTRELKTLERKHREKIAEMKITQNAVKKLEEAAKKVGEARNKKEVRKIVEDLELYLSQAGTQVTPQEIENMLKAIRERSDMQKEIKEEYKKLVGEEKERVKSLQDKVKRLAKETKGKTSLSTFELERLVQLEVILDRGKLWDPTTERLRDISKEERRKFTQDARYFRKVRELELLKPLTRASFPSRAPQKPSRGRTDVRRDITRLQREIVGLNKKVKKGGVAKEEIDALKREVEYNKMSLDLYQKLRRIEIESKK